MAAVRTQVWLDDLGRLRPAALVHRSGLRLVLPVCFQELLHGWPLRRVAGIILQDRAEEILHGPSPREDSLV